VPKEEDQSQTPILGNLQCLLTTWGSVMVVILAGLVGGESKSVVREKRISEVWSLAGPTPAIHTIKEMTEGRLSVLFIYAAFC
jgi:hypothetical protein